MEPRYLLDTNMVIYIRSRRPVSVLLAFERLYPREAAISVITFGELKYGGAKSKRKAEAMETLARIAELIPVLPLTNEAADCCGTIRAELEGRGRPIGNNDLWIAAHAMAARLTLVTNNEKEFRRVRGLKIQNWAKR
jgi:tRNA(fMet)-specific endonuclease VapC